RSPGQTALPGAPQARRRGLNQEMSILAPHPAPPERPLPYRDGFRHDSAHRSALRDGIGRACDRVLQLQADDGHWCGELQGDTILESEYVILMAFLGREREERITRAARYILTQQQPGGAWSNYVGGPPDLSVSVKAYFALKLTGHDPDAVYMRRAREVIRGLG